MKSSFAKTKVWRVPSLGDLELLRAAHQTQSFPRHTHERYAIGVIEAGALGFHYRGENVVAASGDISLCIPGEAHTGQPAADMGWAYRMFYFETSFLETLTSEMADRPRSLPFFQSGVIADDALTTLFRALHIRLEQGTASRLEQDSLLLSVLTQLIGRYADEPLPTFKPRRETQAVTQVKRHLENHYAEPVSLDDLVHLTGLSRGYLVQSFRETVGVPPHAYLRQVRVERAKERLAAGQPVAEVALETGFTDQSHLTRWMGRLWGFTPGQYRTSVKAIQHRHSVQDTLD